jgi:heterotetrameric sarcosine oxidase gamma subunit
MSNPANRKHKAGTTGQASVESRRFSLNALRLEEVAGPALVRVHSLQKTPLPEKGPFRLPETTGHCRGGDPAVLCLRPGEWLLFSETAPAPELLNQLRPKVDPEQTAVLNASDGLAVFRISGTGAPWLLSKLSGLDFLAGKQHGPHCAQTKMGHIAVIVHYHQPSGGAFVFDLLLDRSFANYLWSLLTESADHATELAQNYGDSE